MVLARTVLAAGLLAGLAACATILGIEDARRAGADTSDAAANDDDDDDATVCTDGSQTDPKNCGVCGRSCLGGACERGTCTPGVLLEATVLVPPGRTFSGSVGLAEGKVLWTDRDGPSTYLRACALEACVPQNLATQVARVPPVVASAVYFGNGASIDTVPFDGGVASRKVFVSYQSPNARTAVVGTDEIGGAFLFDMVEDGRNHELRSFPVTNGNAGSTVITAVDSGGGGWTTAFADDTFVYASWPGQGGLTRCRKQGCNGMPTQIGDTLAKPIAVGGRKAIGTRQGATVLTSCTLPECSDERDVRREPDAVEAVATDGTFVYWSNHARVISRCRIDGCETAEVLYRGPACADGCEAGACVPCGNLDIALGDGVLVWSELDRLYGLVLP